MSSPPPLPPTLIGISTKMYFDLPTTTAYISSLPTPPPSTALFIIPSFPALPSAASQLAKLRSANPTATFLLGAQNCHHADAGAHTGEVSPLMLKQIGCDMVELGHAERRAPPFNETDAAVAAKAQAAVRNRLIPLVCIGERSRSSIVSEGVGIAIRECSAQVAAVLDAVPEEGDVVFAYEPVWAIGAEVPAGRDHVVAVVGQLRRIVEGRRRKGAVRWLYGGSAGPGVWGHLKDGVDGLFLGRFAHEVGNVEKVLKEVEEG
ncbi:MAG: hypothetical protein LQ344_006929 [Seirophora lacunosa]|nr:MAG: hypothetical protein LQ344_006929 [Seirophora lacunosa]